MEVNGVNDLQNRSRCKKKKRKRKKKDIAERMTFGKKKPLNTKSELDQSFKLDILRA